MKILIADDDPLTLRFLQEALESWGYEVVAVADGQAAWEVFKRPNAPRMAILDWMMPGLDGVELSKAIRQRHVDSYTYILMLTVRDRKQDVVAGFDAGVDDYLSKPFDENELRGRLRAGARLLEVHDQLVGARETYRSQAEHDHLTGLWSRSAVLEALSRELTRARRSQMPVAIMMVDVDHFKAINDSRGHAAGDTVLQEVANRFRAVSRGYDTIGRYGGEEFLLVLPGCDDEGVVRRANELREYVSSEPFVLPEGVLHVTLSAGACVASGLSEVKPASLLAAADGALYRAKQNGRNRVELAHLPGSSQD